MGPQVRPIIRGLGPQFREIVYISEVNGTRKVKYDAYVAIKKNADPVQNFFLTGSWGGQYPKSNFFKLLELSKTSRARKLMFGLHVNIDQGNSRRYDETR